MIHKREDIQKGKEKMKKIDKKMSFRERLIISPDAQWKSIFDIIVLVLVGISCISNMLIFAYPITFSELLKKFLLSMEFIFGLDLVLNFFMGFRHPDEDSYVTDYKLIAYKYIRSWFFIDFISVIPFAEILGTDTSSGGNVTKLIRLARMPRLAKLIDVGKI